jgi:hypothetical protein
MIFTPDDVQARLHTQPFIPLGIVTTTGQTYDIYHPNLVLVGRRFLVVGIPSSENPTQAELVTRIALGHVADLYDLPTIVHPASDGSVK